MNRRLSIVTTLFAFALIAGCASQSGVAWVTLNGVVTADIQDSKFASGPIALQYAAGVVNFRKVQITPL